MKYMICLGVGSRRNQRCVVNAESLEDAIMRAKEYWKKQGEIVGEYCWGKLLPESSVYAKSGV